MKYILSLLCVAAAAFPICPDGDYSPARGERRVKTRSGESGDLGGPYGGRGRRERVLLMRRAALVWWRIRTAKPPAAQEGSIRH